MNIDSEKLPSKIIFPDPQWSTFVKDEDLKFPIIKYYKISVIDIPKNLTIGGSWNIWSHLPFYRERCAILEKLYMPYIIDSKYLKIKHGVLLWPRINLSAYTFIDDPQRVFLKKNNKFVVELRFNSDNIEIFEIQD